MTFILFFLLIVLLAAGLGPGLYLVRRLSWGAPERLCAAIGLSGIALYLASGAVYISGAPRGAYFAVSIICAGLFAASWKEVRSLLRHLQTRRMAAGFAFLFAWTLVLLAMTRNYSGAFWSDDWIEHFQRALFFLNREPKDTIFNVYPLPARPPFMNLIAAHFLGQVGQRYDLYQVTMTALNLLVVFPCWLLARHFSGRSALRTCGTAIVCLLAASPMFIENATYTWTKGFANFYVLAGLWFYLRGWRRSDPARMLAAFLSLTAGLLVHYSAAPYLVLLLLHYAIFVWRRRTNRGREAVRMAGACGLLAATWFGWSFATYGLDATLSSNTTASAAAKMTVAQNMRKVALNLVDTVVPHPLRIGFSRFREEFYQPNSWGFLRDYTFTWLQTNLVFGMGTIAGLVVLWLFVRSRPLRRPADAVERRFWIGLVLGGAILSVATHPTLDDYGVAHVCSQPLMLLGICFLASRFAVLTGTLRCAVVAGVVLDSFLGIFLHFSLQNWVVDLGRGGAAPVMLLRWDMISETGVFNATIKKELEYRFFGDHFGGVILGLQLLGIAGLAVVVWLLVRVSHRPAAIRQMPAASWGVAALPAILGGAYLVLLPASHREIVPDPSDDTACAAAVQASPDSGEAHFNLGIALYRRGQFDSAVGQWIETLLLNPDHAAARYFSRIFGSFLHQPLPQAAAVAENVRVNPLSADAHDLLGRELWQARHEGPAELEFQKAVKLNPELADAWEFLGRLYLELGRMPESIASFSEVLSRDPKNAEMHFLIAVPLYRSGRIPDAVAHLREAIRLKPDFAEARTALQQLGG